MKNRLSDNKHIRRLLWTLLLLVVWQAFSMSKAFSPLVFPSVYDVAKALYSSVINGDIIRQVLFSLMLISQGMIAGVALAVLLSYLSIRLKLLEGLADTLISIANPLPGIALLPLIILWTGTGTASIVVIIIHSVLWPLSLNILTGFRSISKIYREIGENYGLSSAGIVRKIMIPSALPYILTGIKIGWSRAWRALISAEMVFGAAGGQGGLGWYIFKSRVFMDTPAMYGGIIVIIAIGMLVEGLVFDKIENATVKKWGMTV